MTIWPASQLKVNLTPKQVESFESRYEVDNYGCWIWDGPPTHNGYGLWTVNGYQTSAHRLSYLAFVGDIPSGMVVHHRCEVRKCVNHDHLELLTVKQHRDTYPHGLDAERQLRQ